nr:hypothetical protein [bacterium]
MIHDVIIVGSGATGIASALGFSESGIVPLMLDVGKVPAKRSGIDGNFYDHRKKNDSFNLMIGPEYEGLYNILNNTSLPPKLTAPEMSFVTEDNAELSRTREEGFTAMQSFARGGLANAWGAGLYRCVSDELKDMPLSVEELAPYYEMLTQEVGISGDSDDLASFFGSVDGLLPPLNLSLKAERLYNKYHKKRDGLNKNGVYAGRPRLGVLSRNHGGRRAYMYQNNDMWLSDTPFLYTPAMTLQKLVEKQAVNYESGILVQRWSGDQGEITVYGRRLSDGIEVEYKCRNLVLAAGTI